MHEDNSSAFVLAEILPPQLIAHSKSFATKNIWLYYEIFKGDIKILSIDTIHKLEDLFTKGFPKSTFKYHEKKFTEWKNS